MCKIGPTGFVVVLDGKKRPTCAWEICGAAVAAARGKSFSSYSRSSGLPGRERASIRDRMDRQLPGFVPWEEERGKTDRTKPHREPGQGDLSYWRIFTRIFEQGTDHAGRADRDVTTETGKGQAGGAMDKGRAAEEREGKRHGAEAVASCRTFLGV